jgi:hypothetical protein
MTNVDWFNTLSPDVQDKIVHNVNSLNHTITFEWWADRPLEDGSSAVLGAFVWVDSPEGHSYWSNINSEYVDNDIQ